MAGCYGVILLLMVTATGRVSALTVSEKAAFSVNVTLEEVDGVYKFFSSGYPPHDIDNNVNPNMASVQNFTYNFTMNPSNTGSEVWCTSLGPVGFAKNGVAIYNALTGDSTDAVRYETFDDCKGHTSPDGAYHYHQFSACFGDMEDVDLFVGIALDGNPIYGPNASDWSNGLLTSTDLDACHGRFVGGNYRYHVTEDFPYIIGCYKAEPASGQLGGMGSPDGMGPPRGGGMGPPPGRKRRQAQEAVCTNAESGAELCDCTRGTLTQCDTLTGEDSENCEGSNDGDDNNGPTDAGVRAVLSSVSAGLVLMLRLLV